RSIFFGRNEEIADLRNLCMAYPVVVLYSQSGAGKSSLIRAGLRPALIRQCVRILPFGRVAGQVNSALEKGNIYVLNALSTLCGKKASLTKSFSENLSCTSEHYRSRRRHRAIFFDQFEEFFTAYPDRWKEREDFFMQVNEALKADSELRVVFVIREERIAELDSYSDTLPTNFRIRYRLERLKEDGARAAIQQPLQKFGWSISDPDADKLITNLPQIKGRADKCLREAEGEYVEPVHLQVVCHDIWRKRDEERSDKTLRVPDNVQNIDHALAAYYDAAIKRAARDAQVRESRIRNWFETELITPRGTRGFVFKGEESTEGLSNRAVAILEAEHIVRSEPRGPDLWYELTHDRLIAPI